MVLGIYNVRIPLVEDVKKGTGKPKEDGRSRPEIPRRLCDGADYCFERDRLLDKMTDDF
jgi:hypothetical protein